MSEDAKIEPSPIDEYLDRKLVMLTGKGGVGKSFLSLMLALRAVQLGKKVLLMELTSHPQHHAALSLEPKQHQIQKYSERLHHINITYEYNFRDYMTKYLGLEKLFEQVFNRDIVKSFLRMVPGLNEITFLGRLYYECMINKNDPYDLLIFDAFSSGHFHKLLTTPDGVVKAGLVGPVMEESKNIKNFLSSKQNVAVLYCSLAEKLVTTEVQQFVQMIGRDTPTSVDAIILNRIPRSQATQWQQDDNISRYMNHRIEMRDEAASSIRELAAQSQVDKLISTYNLGPVPQDSIPLRFVEHWNSLGFKVV